MFTPFDNGFLINDHYAYACDNNHEKYINCKTSMGDEMPYAKNNYKIIDYPGEYNIDNINVDVFEVQGQLQYIVTEKEKKFAIISTLQAVEIEEMNETIQQRIVTDPSIFEQMEKYELEGNVVVLK